MCIIFNKMYLILLILYIQGTGLPSQVVLVVQNPPANARDVREVGSSPKLGRYPRGGHGSPLQDSFQENPWTEKLGGLQSMSFQGVGNDLVTK